MRPNGDWITTAHACEILGIVQQSTAELRALDHYKCDRIAGVPGRSPYLWRRHDIERIAGLRREAKLGIEAAVRVIVAEQEGRLYFVRESVE